MGYYLVDDSLIHMCYNAHCPTSPRRALPSPFDPVLQVPPILTEGLWSGRGQFESVDGLELSDVRAGRGASHVESHVKSERKTKQELSLNISFSHVLQSISKNKSGMYPHL